MVSHTFCEHLASPAGGASLRPPDQWASASTTFGIGEPWRAKGTMRWTRSEEAAAEAKKAEGASCTVEMAIILLSCFDIIMLWVIDNWFTQHFLVQAPPARPLLLLLDGHSTHCHYEGCSEQVIVFCQIQHICCSYSTREHLDPSTSTGTKRASSLWGKTPAKWSQSTLSWKCLAKLGIAFRMWCLHFLPQELPFCPTKVSATDTTNKCQKLLNATGLPFLPVYSVLPIRLVDQ